MSSTDLLKSAYRSVLSRGLSKARSGVEHHAFLFRERHEKVVAATQASAVGHLPYLLDAAVAVKGSSSSNSPHQDDRVTNFTDDWETKSWSRNEKLQAQKYYDPAVHSRQPHRDHTLPIGSSFEERNALLSYLNNPINRKVHDDIHAVLDDDRMAVDHQRTSPHVTPPLYTTGDALIDRRLKATFGDRDAVLPRTTFDVQLEEYSRTADPLTSSGPAHRGPRSAPFYPPRTLTPRLAEDPVNETPTMHGVAMPVPHRQFSTLPYAHLRGTANHFDSIYTDASVVLQQERESGVVDSCVPDTSPPMYFESKAHPHHYEHKMKWWTPIWEQQVRFVNRGEQLSRLVQWQRTRPPTTTPRFWYNNILKAFTHEHPFLPIPDTAVHGMHFEPWKGPQPAWQLPTFNFPLRPRFQRFWPPAANNPLTGSPAASQEPGMLTWPPQRLADLAVLREMDAEVKKGADALPHGGGRKRPKVKGIWWSGPPDSPNSFWGATKAAGGDWRKTGRPDMYPVPPQLYDMKYPYNRPVGKRRGVSDERGNPVATAIPFGNDDVTQDVGKKK